MAALLTIDEAAEYLGVARSTFYDGILPLIPQVRVTPGRVQFRQEDLDAYIESVTRQPGEADAARTA